MSEKRLYHAYDLASEFDVSVATVRRWIRLGLVRCVEVGRSKRIEPAEYQRVIRDGIPRRAVSKM